MGQVAELSQGARANFTGKSLESVIENMIARRFTYVGAEHFVRCFDFARPIYTKQIQLCQSIYGTPIRCDFVVYHPDLSPSDYIIECKWQEQSGSADEKFPWLVANIRERYPHQTIIVLDGGGYRESARQWLLRQVDDRLIHVFTIGQFLKWANRRIPRR